MLFLTISQPLRILVYAEIFTAFHFSFLLLLYFLYPAMLLAVNIVSDIFLLTVSWLFCPLLNNLCFILVILAGVEHILSETCISTKWLKTLTISKWKVTSLWEIYKKECTQQLTAAMKKPAHIYLANQCLLSCNKVLGYTISYWFYSESS